MSFYLNLLLCIVFVSTTYSHLFHTLNTRLLSHHNIHNRELLSELSGSIQYDSNSEGVFYLCGPTSLVDETETALSLFFNTENQNSLKAYKLGSISHQKDGSMCFILQSTYATAELFQT